ncbi:MAG TPA: hypothetical protein VGM18_07605 [Candidatus Sulfotelmatobacter sp.]|jgi:hypothetical protein
MVSGVRKQIDIARLKSDLASASVELLSAHCAADRVRLQYSPKDIIEYAEPRTLQRAIGSAEAVYKFFSQIAAQMNQSPMNPARMNQEDANR